MGDQVIVVDQVAIGAVTIETTATGVTSIVETDESVDVVIAPVSTVEEVEDVGRIVEMDQGVVGETGPPGPTGAIGGFYAYTQIETASVWTIVHDLGYFPAVTVTDSTNTVVYGSIEYLDVNTVRLSFSAPFSGVAYLS